MSADVPSEAPQERAGSIRAIFWALGANVAITVAKFAGAWLSGSGSMLAEAMHSVADSANQLLLLWGRRQAGRPPSETHPLGYGREMYFWSFIVALLLFGMGGVASVYDGVHKLGAHAGIESPWIPIAILVFAAVAEGVSTRVALHEINRHRGERNLWRWFRETRRSELIIVLGENIADLAGIAVAFVAIVLTWATGNTIYDAAGSIVIGALLVAVAISIGVEAKSLLIGESAAPELRRSIRSLLAARPEILRVLELITSQYGDDVVVAVKAQMRPAPGAHQLVLAISACEAALKSAFPQVRWVFFEPDLAPEAADTASATENI